MLLLALVYFSAAVAANRLTEPFSSVAPVWPGSGIAVAALLLYGARLWPGAWLGSFVFNLPVLSESARSWPMGTLCAALVATGSTLTVWIAAEVTRRGLRRALPSRDLGMAVAYLGAVAALAPAVGALIGTFSLQLANYVYPSEWLRAFWGWWLGDTAGLLIFTPPLLLIARSRPRISTRRQVEAFALLLAMALAGILAFGPVPLQTGGRTGMSLLFVPLLVWACLRFGLYGATLGTVIIGFLGVVFTSLGVGPLIHEPGALLHLQLFLIVISASMLTLAAALEDRKDAIERLHRHQRNLEVQISERTEELRRALALHHAIVDATADGILALDLEDRVVLVNRSFQEMWSLPEGEYAGTDARVSLASALEQVEGASEDVLVHYSETKRHPERETVDEVKLRNGHVFVRVSKPQRLDGKVVGRVWSFRDVTGERRAERERERLLLLEQQARLAAEAAEMRSKMLAEAGRRLAASIDYRTTLRAAVDAALGFGNRASAIYLEIGGDLRCEAAATVGERRTLWIRGEMSAEPPVVDVTGAARRALTDAAPHAEPLDGVLCAPMIAHGLTLGALCVWREEAAELTQADKSYVAELARRCALAIENASLYEKAQKAVRARDEFLSIASHELKTPLATLKLQLQHLERSLRSLRDSAPDAGAKVDVTLRQADRLAGLIDELLDISRISTDRLLLSPEEIDAGELVRSVVESAREAIPDAPPIEVRLEGDLHGRWDRSRVEQVVRNLVSNAIKYGAGRPVVVAVSGERECIRIVVADQGIGISERDRKRIFEPFERAVSQRQVGGIGLGLWIVRQVVECFGGTIEVESTEGEGSTFVVVLPRFAATEEARI